MTQQKWMQVLVLAVTVDLMVYTLLDTPLFAQHLQQSSPRSLQVLEAVAHLVTAAALLAVAHGTVKARRESLHDRQLLAATDAASPDWIWETDTAHRYTYSSLGVTALLGYRPEEIVGRHMHDLLATGEDAGQLVACLRACSEARTPWHGVEVAWRHRDGHAVTLSSSGSPIIDESGRVIGHRGSRRLVADTVDVAELLRTSRRHISEAIMTRAVHTALQPIVSVADRRLVGVEALARFDDGRAPDVWFSEARATGQNLDLDRLAFTTALGQLDVLPSHAYLSINASPELILSPMFGEELLRRGAATLDRLVIEITEHERICDYQRVKEVLQPLRDLGARVAVDDAGAGYASLTHVLQLRPDIIKIDRDLLTDVDGDSARRSLITALVLVALDLGATVTGEGVETPGQMAALDLLAVDHAQGYFVGRPSTDPAQWRQWWTQDWSQRWAVIGRTAPLEAPRRRSRSADEPGSAEPRHRVT
jgi:PAS domain S-box-containing protein